jgi:hypothetical protein
VNIKKYSIVFFLYQVQQAVAKKRKLVEIVSLRTILIQSYRVRERTQEGITRQTRIMCHVITTIDSVNVS